MPRKELGTAGCNSGSCDSMASTASNHSQRSDNSYDYLSVEEKECLMFLEETIGSLDAEGDSGVSTDDTDSGEPSQPRRGPVARGELEKTFLQPGCAREMPWAGRECPGVMGLSWFPSLQGTTCTLRGRAAWNSKIHLPEVNCFPITVFFTVILTFNLGNGNSPPSRDRQRGAEQKSGKSISASSSPAAAPSTAHSNIPKDVPAANGAFGSKGSVHTVPAGKPAQEVPREGRLEPASAGSHTKSVMIQPPDPFQDELEWSRSRRSDAKETKIRTSWGSPEKPTLEEAPQDPDAKRGPPTAPKPRRLPPNIILKTSRNSPVPLASDNNQKVKASPPPSAASQPSPAGDSPAEKGNSGHLDPKEKEKARREALEKLGLPQDRRERGAHLHPHPGETPLPIPGQPGEGSLPGIRQIAFKSNTLERSGVGLGSSMGSSSSKEQSSRSSSSSLGKMSFIERLAPSFLRGSRPRPTSLGPGKDFAGLKEQEEQDKSSKRRSHPLPGVPRPPRSAVSVKISPKGAADENRREALKKLGLLKE
ncbi:SARG protein, partial [Alaudala cheleensis]|nr:SARG protein [Alaudala cheleensis]